MHAREGKVPSAIIAIFNVLLTLQRNFVSLIRKSKREDLVWHYVNDDSSSRDTLLLE